MKTRLLASWDALSTHPIHRDQIKIKMNDEITATDIGVATIPPRARRNNNKQVVASRDSNRPQTQEEKQDRRKASVRAAQARYHAKRKEQLAADEAFLEIATAEIKSLEDEKQRLLIASTVNTIQLETKDEILNILQHPVTIGASNPTPTLTSNAASTPEPTNTTPPDIPAEYNKEPLQPNCEVQAVVVNKLQELTKRHGSIPPSMMTIEDVKKMSLAMYASEWRRLSLETQSLVNKLASLGGRDEETEREIDICLEGQVPFFMMPLRYNPQLFQEFFLSGSLVVPGTDDAERRKYLVDYLGVTPSQVAQFQVCWHQYHNQMISAQNEQNKAIIESTQIVVPTKSARPPASDGGGGGLEDFASIQEMMMAYCSLVESTSEFEAWQKKKLLGFLQMISAADSIFQTIQKAKVVSLCAPNCPDVLTVASILGKYY